MGLPQNILNCRDGSVLGQGEIAGFRSSLAGVASPRRWSLAALGFLPGADQFGH
jgi:hypothetical protein